MTAVAAPAGSAAAASDPAADLLAELLDADARERARIARGLHDDVAQRLVAALVLVERAALDQARGALDEALGSCLELLDALHPPLLEAAGVPGAVEALATEARRERGATVLVRAAAGRHPFTVEWAVLEAMRAGLEAALAAGARRVELAVDEAGGTLRGRLVADAGRASRRLRLALARVRALGGEAEAVVTGEGYRLEIGVAAPPT